MECAVVGMPAARTAVKIVDELLDLLTGDVDTYNRLGEVEIPIIELECAFGETVSAGLEELIG